jgi:hypothetical protein
MAMAIRRYGGLDIHDKSSSGRLPHMAAYNVLKDALKFCSLTSPPTKRCSSSLSGDQSNSDNLDIVIPGEQEAAHAPLVEEQVDSDSNAGTASAVLLRPLGRKSSTDEKKSSQIDRLTQGGEAHANALRRIAIRMEDTAKKRRSDEMLSVSSEDMALLDPEDRERIKRVRAERAKGLIARVEDDYGIKDKRCDRMSF